ncbi:MAG: hypothetical protein Q4C82_06030 [Eubacteriales bacterium]|nr:hypothetical protein [Eubacteriales bacterium]
MDLMQESTDYGALRKKYGEFRAPSMEVTVGTTRLAAGEKADVRSLELELTSGLEASGCVFFLENVYEEKQTDFKKFVEKLQLGEMVEVELGYVRRESLFKGYVNKIDYQFGMEDGSCRIRVECMDVKGLLMKTRRMEFFTQKSADAVVGFLLGEPPVSGYLSGKELDSCPEDEVPLRSHMMTDYELISEQADKHGYEFFILQGKAYFRKRQKVTSAIATLSPGKGILRAGFSISAQSLVDKIEIRSVDASSGARIQGEASISGSFGKGSGPSKLLKQTRQVFYEPGVKDASEAALRAQARMDDARRRFGQLECECVGIPELAPGRFVEVEGLSGIADRKYYITYVRHVFDEEGYRTYITAGADSL